MSSEDTMVASEAEDVAHQDAASAAVSANRRVRVDVSPISTASTVTPQSQQRQGWWRQESEEGNAEPKMRATWFKDMRGWLMVLAMQVASSTYQAGLNPPRGFSGDGTSIFESTSKTRYHVFFYSNTTAFVTSLASIILLMNPSFYYSEAKVVALETIVVLDLVGLMCAYWAGTTSGSRDETTNTKYTLVLTVLVLFVVYVEYTVQLLPKLCRLAAKATTTAAKTVAVAVTPRVHAGDAAPVVPSQIDEARSSAAATQRLSATPRRRGSRLAVTEPSSMLSP